MMSDNYPYTGEELIEELGEAALEEYLRSLKKQFVTISAYPTCNPISNPKLSKNMYTLKEMVSQALGLEHDGKKHRSISSPTE